MVLSTQDDKEEQGLVQMGNIAEIRRHGQTIGIQDTIQKNKGKIE